ncbi:adenosine deaminase [Roseiflexus castenholzii DSM 13941]|uniref:Adenosine deaminase n=1 Tax=Roseiflexus castenholzii (strain DSM 13941 / HLO8) TaxID=383372 RepID=A7NLW2_ROSCS|nr:adenosine deaminase [Roseiflexus castenholzii DSM 13941]
MHAQTSVAGERNEVIVSAQQQRISALDEFIVRMPKVELHLHLEGAIRPATLLALAERNGVDLPARDEAGVAQLFTYRNFHEFLTVFMVLARSLTTGRDFEQVAYELGVHLAEQNVRYAEVMISPVQYHRRALDLDEVVQGAAAGFIRAAREYNVRVGLVFDYGRQFGVDLAWNLLESAIRNMKHGVVGWSIGGDEINHPPEPFAEVFAAARRAGLQVMAHAGEVVGPLSVWSAIETLGARRIGHGIRSIDDPALVAYLRTHNVVLDVCPTSNIRTGAVSSLDAHPLRRLFDAGVPLTLNTDDPVFFGTTLCREYRLAVQHFGFTADDLVRLTLTGAHAAFLPKADRLALARELEREIADLRADLGV